MVPALPPKSSGGISPDGENQRKPNGIFMGYLTAERIIGMKDKLLALLTENARLTTEELAAMLDTTPEAVAEKMDQYERSGVIRGYQAIIDEEQVDRDLVTAIIDLRVTPKKDMGFDAIAQIVAEFDEVDSVYLMSGGYDLAVIVKGHNFKDIAMFVATRLSTLDSVLSTKTHFLLSRYKERGILMNRDIPDQRSEAF